MELNLPAQVVLVKTSRLDNGWLTYTFRHVDEREISVIVADDSVDELENVTAFVHYWAKY